MPPSGSEVGTFMFELLLGHDTRKFPYRYYGFHVITFFSKSM